MKALLIASRRRLSPYLLFLIAGVLVLAACGNATAKRPTTTATPAPAHATAPPVPPTATSVTSMLYVSTDHSFAIDYPPTWSTHASNAANTSGAIAFAAPDSSDFLFIFPLTTHVDSGQYSAVAQDFLTTGISATDVALNPSTGTITLPAGTWTTLDGTGTFNNAAYDFTQLALDHDGNTIFMYILVPNATANDDVTKYYAPMLQSFNFLK